MSSCAIGVDIGGTKIAVGAVDAAGAVHARRTIATDAEAGFEAGLERLTRAIDETLAEAGIDVATLAGIGLGCPGPFDEATGRIENFGDYVGKCRRVTDWAAAGGPATRLGRPVAPALPPCRAGMP
ncbi:MAG: ROK family protein [Rhodospirillaceae bacterium]|nr:ROK family protein [Rhodospirillaceae bacterium]